MNRYVEGNLVRVSSVFTDLNGAFVDPTVVYLDVQKPDLTITTYQYGQGNTIVKDSTGHYHTDLDTTHLLGTWQYEWRSTGTGQAASGGQFYVYDIITP